MAEKKPASRRFLIFGAIAFLVASIGLLGLRAEVEFTCDRAQTPAPTCQLIQSNVVGQSRTEIRLADLQGAALEAKRSRTGGVMHRVVLRTRETETPLTAYLASELIAPEAEKQAVIEQINTFLKTEDKQVLQVRLDDRWFFQIGSVVMVISSIAFGILAWRATPESTQPKTE